MNIWVSLPIFFEIYVESRRKRGIIDVSLTHLSSKGNESMKGKRFSIKLGLGRQIFLLTCFFVLVAAVIIGYTSTMSEINKTRNDAEKSIRVQLEMEKAMIDLYYPGNWEIRDGQLYKGLHVLNENQEIVDIITKSTGGHLATIFQDDNRVSTSVKDSEGKRKLNTKASPEVTEQVLKQGKSYVGAVDVAGQIIYSAYEPIKESTGKVIGMIYIGDPDTKNEIDASVKSAKTRTWIIGLLILLGTAAACYVYSRRLAKRLKAVQNKLQLITQGDLTSDPLPTKERDEIDSLTGSVNLLNTDLKNIVLSIQQASHQMAAASEELSATSEETSASTEQVSSITERLAAGSETQMNLVGQTAETVEQMAEELSHISSLSVDVKALMAEAADSANYGFTEGQRVLDQMKEIMISTNKTFEAIESLAERSQEIGEIAGIMSNLSNQTNLLALNAAIEAARAGESGRGFAVVATEIRKLAEQSTESANKVAVLVGAILSDTDQATKWVKTDSEAVIAGAEISERVNISFTGIQSSFDVVVTKLADVSGALTLLNQGGDDITRMVDQVKASANHGSEATHHVSASCQEQMAAMEEIASSAQSLASLADHLQEMLLKFKL